MQRRWRTAFAGAVTAVTDAGLGVLFVLFVSGRFSRAWQRLVPVVHLRRLVRPLRAAVRAHRKIAVAGAGAAVVAVWLFVLLLVSGSRPAAAQRAVPVAQPPLVPVMHLAHMPIGPLPDAGPTQLVSPFTGEPVKTLGRVLAVKIDNIVDARPPDNLTSADIVYLLPVEGGLSRIFAVYSSRIPNVIGPVRSAREDDLELLQQFGRPGFAYSGATPHLIPFIARARLVNLYALDDPSAYFRDYNRVAPHNLYAYGSVLRAELRGASRAHDIGFRFGPAPPGGHPTTSFTVSYPEATFTFRWSARSHRWLVWMDGTQATDAAGGYLGAATVIIQDTDVRTSRFREYGFRPPYAESTGSGTAVVLRDGRAWRVRWSRPNPDSGTSYTLPSGARMTFAPGQEWVVLTTTDWAHAGL
jgi:Protein of unknown function (DUF3048) N-terminal domain/Protein of unknown function (DUF3048) C-terminal domain